jgi:hypothetical protein
MWISTVDKPLFSVCIIDRGREKGKKKRERLYRGEKGKETRLKKWSGCRKSWPNSMCGHWALPRESPIGKVYLLCGSTPASIYLAYYNRGLHCTWNCKCGGNSCVNLFHMQHSRLYMYRDRKGCWPISELDWNRQRTPVCKKIK